MLHRPTVLLACVASLGAVPSGCQHDKTLTPTAAARFQELRIEVGGNRRLGELDVTGDGRVGEADWRVFERVSKLATRELERQGGTTNALAGLYHGSEDSAAPLVRTLRPDTPDFGLPALSKQELWQLAIESRWLGLQARAASLAGSAPLDRAFGGLLAHSVPGYDADKMTPRDLCRAVDQVDTAPLRSVGLAATAVTDLDSTVWRGNVMDVFLAVLVEQRLPHPEANPELAAYLKGLEGVDVTAVDRNTVIENARLLLDLWRNETLAPAARPTAKDTFYQIAQLLRGMTPAEARAAARIAFEKGALDFPAWTSQIYTDVEGCGMRELIRRMEARGIEMYLLSATPDVLAWEAARVMGVPEHRSIGSLLEVVDGRYTGQVFDSTYYTKGTIVRQWVAAPPLLAFGDSVTSDFSMLAEAVGAGFMINAHEAFLERDAREAGSRLVAVTFSTTEGEATALP